MCLFSAMVVPASSASGHVFGLDVPMPVQTPRVCPTPVWRRCHPRDGEGSETVVTSSAAEKRSGALVPSDSKTWLHSTRAPVSPKCGGGAAPVHRARRSPPRPAPERRSHQRPQDPGQRASGLRRVQ